jgi:esterase/lipase
MARYYELADLRERAMNAVAKKTLMGEIELVDRSDIMIPDDLTRARYTTKIPMAMETVFHLLNYEPIESAHKVSVPTLMFGVETDKLCPSRQTTDFYARLTVEKQLKMFAKGEHWAVYDEVLPEVAAGTISWFDQYLKVER